MRHIDFRITSNNLHNDSAIKSLQLANAYYRIKIFYYGNYAADKKTQKIDANNLSVKCTPIGNALDLTIYDANLIEVELAKMASIPATQIDQTIKQLQIASDCINSLQRIMHQYF